MDWLGGLFHEKKVFQNNIQKNLEQKDSFQDIFFEHTLENHKKLLEIVAESNIEKLLMDLITAVIDGHPDYPTAYLKRSCSFITCEESAGMDRSKFGCGLMWQSNNRRADALWSKNGLLEIRFPNNAFLNGVAWTLSLHVWEEKKPANPSNGYFQIGVLVTPNVLWVGKNKIDPHSSGAVQNALISAYQCEVQKLAERAKNNALEIARNGKARNW